jgi:hypothetical protein
VTVDIVPFLDWLKANLWDAIAFLAVLVGLGVFIWKKAWRGVVAFAKGIVQSAEILEAVRDLPAFIKRSDDRHADLAEKVDGIHHETHTNDGSSIKDAAARIEVGVASLHARMDDVENTVKELRQADVEIRAEIKHHKTPEGGTS